MADLGRSWQPLGAVKVVTTAGTPVQLTTANIRVNQIWIQPMKSLSAAGTPPVDNAGFIYLINHAGASGSPTAKGAASTNIVAAIGTGQNTVGLPAHVYEVRGMNLSDFWLDADNSLDGALISYA